MSEASSRPWVMEDRTVYGRAGETICDVLDTCDGLIVFDSTADANGELIVRAVNHFDDLMAALKSIAAGMGNLSLEMMGDAGVAGINDGKARAIYLESFVRIARETLAKVEPI